MKKNYIKLCILICSIYFISCTDDMIKTEGIENNASSEYNVLPTDSLQIKYDMQSNFELMVADRIIYKNSSFVLDLSSEEASQLMIPKDVYQEAIKKVEMLNKSPQN